MQGTHIEKMNQDVPTILHDNLEMDKVDSNASSGIEVQQSLSFSNPMSPEKKNTDTL